MSIKIYGPRMGSALRCHWTLAEVGTAYESVAVDFARAEHKSPAFLQLNPVGQVPVLVDGDFRLAESVAICSYVIDKAGSDLGGKTPEERAQALRWSIWALVNPQESLGTLASPMWTNTPLPADVEAKEKAEASRHLAVLEGHLAKSPYVAGDRFTVGDINVACSLAYAAMSKFDLSPFPATSAWLAKVTARPACAKARG
jgi:glutathione S-transferase